MCWITITLIYPNNLIISISVELYTLFIYNLKVFLKTEAAEKKMQENYFFFFNSMLFDKISQIVLSIVQILENIDPVENLLSFRY